MAFIAMVEEGGKETEIGVARYATNPDGESCEFAIVVSDSWQGKGVARRLMGVLIDAARASGLKYMNGDFLAENTRMLRFVSSLGFVLSPHPEDSGLKRGVLVLD
jgi:acetyltransferase